jgi:hypothetical protein
MPAIKTCSPRIIRFAHVDKRDDRRQHAPDMSVPVAIPPHATVSED